MTFEWLSTWWRHFGTGRQLFVLVFKEEQNITGIIPWGIRKVWKERTNFRKIEFIGSGLSDWLDFIIPDRKKEHLELLLQYLQERSTVWDLIDLREFPSTSENAIILQKILRENRFTFRIYPDSICPYIAIQTDWASFLHNQFSSKSRWQIRKKLKKLRSHGEPDIKYFCDVTDKPEIINRISQMRQDEYYHGMRRQGIFQDQIKQQFFKEVTLLFSRRGWVNISLLEISDQLIAYRYGFQYLGKYYDYFHGYDPNFFPCSPGKILMMHLMEECFNNKMREFDFLRGDETYKFDLTDQYRQNIRMMLFKPSLLGRFLDFSYIMRRVLSKKAAHSDRNRSIRREKDKMVMDAIETIQLTKKFIHQKGWKSLFTLSSSSQTTAIDNLTLTINQGEIFGILGPNGAGKTTLVKILCTLLLPSSGTAKIFGRDVILNSSEVRKDIGLVTSDERSFHWRLTGRQNLQFFAAIYKIPSYEIKKRIENLIELFQLDEIIDLRFNEYSTGMKQKLAIARGLLNQPRLLFMDEPTKGLDPIASHNLLKLIKGTVTETLKGTIVVCTNNTSEAQQLCNRMAILNHGKLIYFGRPQEIKSNFQKTEYYHLRARHFAECHLPDMRKIDGVIDCFEVHKQDGITEVTIELMKDSTALSSTLKLIVQNQCEILSWSKKEDNFDEIVRKLMLEPDGLVS